MILIFSDSITERLEYTLNFVFKMRGMAYEITNDPNLFLKSNHPHRLVYSDYPFDEQFPTIQPASLLFEEDILSHNLQKATWNNCSCLKFGKIIDPLASIFYVLSRYEEYLDFAPDEHDRFTASQSILKKMEWLKEPICDVWANCILKWLNQTYDTIHLQKAESNLLVTFDIDNTFAFKYKSTVQHLGGRIKDFVTGNHQRIDQRNSVLSDGEKDPFDTFELILDYGAKGVEIQLFWLLGDLKKYDRNVSWTNPAHQRLIRNLAQRFSIGIHPSYFSNSVPSKLAEERGRLEHILQKPVFHSRQHFLKLRLPTTYHNLLQIGIHEDFSMGFSDEVGFRMGTARKVNFFDLTIDATTDLKLQPFVYMDGTLNQYLKLSPDEAIETTQQLVNQVVKYGGTFCCIWHNETIGNSGIWQDWKRVLDENIRYFNKVTHQ